MHRASEFGVSSEHRRGLPRDHQAQPRHRRQDHKGVGFLFRKNKIDHVPGTAKLLPRAARGARIRCTSRSTAGGEQIVEAKHVIIATGARAKSLPGIALDGERIIEYRKAMTLPAQPRSMIVLGSGRSASSSRRSIARSASMSRSSSTCRGSCRTRIRRSARNCSARSTSAASSHRRHEADVGEEPGRPRRGHGRAGGRRRSQAARGRRPARRGRHRGEHREPRPRGARDRARARLDQARRRTNRCGDWPVGRSAM